MAAVFHKQNNPKIPPKVSIVLLDWSVRERFHTLDWLARQTVPRNLYELIWIELYDRVVPEALEKCEVLIACHQEGMYHKHVGYNIGFLQAKGQIVTFCDSDAVFPPDFVASILRAFHFDGAGEPNPLVLMHYEWRTARTYPDDLTDVGQLSQYKWYDLWPNVGACMSVRREDALRFGGFDEHPSLRGYMCGPYELGWRLINAGIPETWHDERIALWHFAHPDPVASFGQRFSWKLWREIAYPHVEGHALTALEAFSTGRLLPLQENPDVHRLRMACRRIGSALEEKLSRVTGPDGFSVWDMLRFRLVLLQPALPPPLSHVFRRIYLWVKRQLLLRGGRKGFEIVSRWIKTEYQDLSPQLVLEKYKGFNLVLYKGNFHALALALGPVDLKQDHLSEAQAPGLYATARTFEEIKRRVDELATPRKAPKELIASSNVDDLDWAAFPKTSIRLMESGYWGFNIVLHDDQCIGVAQTLGPVHLELLSKRALTQHQQDGTLIIGKSAGGVKHLIRRSVYRIYLAKALALARQDPRLTFRKAFRKLGGLLLPKAKD